MKTYDNSGRLLGDTEPAPAPAAAAVVPPVVSFDLSVLLQPPYIYVLVAAVGIAAYFYERNHK